MGLELEGITVNKESHEVSVYISRYIAKKLTPRVVDCCASMVVGENNNEYLKILTRGGLTTPSTAHSDYVSSCFAILDEVYPTIKLHGLRARVATECFLQQVLLAIEFAFHSHSQNCVLLQLANKTSERSESQALVDDSVRELKQSKCNLP